MKKTGLILTIGGIIVFPLVSYDLFGEKNLPVELTVPLMIMGIASIFLGPAFCLFDLPLERRRKITKRSFILSLALILIGTISKLMLWPLAGIEFIIGVLIFSFFYGALSFKIKYEKWKVYARSKYDALLIAIEGFETLNPFAWIMESYDFLVRFQRLSRSIAQ